MLINNLIKYYKQKGQIFHQGAYIAFDEKSKEHINIVINNLMSDIDNALRFKIKNYLLNYSLLCKAKLGNIDNSMRWVDYLEYGTTDSTVIELQVLGIPRHLATFIIQNHAECLELVNGVVTNFDENLLKNKIDKAEFEDEYNELAEIFEWDVVVKS